MGLLQKAGGSISRETKKRTPKPKPWMSPKDAVETIGSELQSAGEWVQARLQEVGDWLEEQAREGVCRVLNETRWQFIAPPRLRSFGEQYGGEPVLYVNGILTTLPMAAESARFLSNNLRRPVQLLYNPTVGPGDLLECIYDKLWVPPFRQHNPTTMQLAYIMYKASGQLSLVTHSQGCILAQNAVLTMAYLCKKDWVEENLAWVAAAPPVPDPYVTPDKYNPLVIEQDLVAQWIGVRGGGDWYRPDIYYHFFIHDDKRDGEGMPLDGVDPGDYLSMIEPSMIYSSSSPVASRHFVRYPQILNTTNETLDIKTQVEFPSNGQWHWTTIHQDSLGPGSEYGQLPAGRALRLVAHNRGDGSAVIGDWNSAFQMAPDSGYASSSGDMESFTVTISDDTDDTRDAIWEPFAIESGEDGERNVWLSASERGAEILTSRGQARIMTPALGTPTTDNGPFNGDLGPLVSLGHRHLWFELRDKKDVEHFFVPRSGNGTIWAYSIINQRWSAQGELESYQPSVTHDPEWRIPRSHFRIDSLRCIETFNTADVANINLSIRSDLEPEDQLVDYHLQLREGDTAEIAYVCGFDAAAFIWLYEFPQQYQVVHYEADGQRPYALTPHYSSQTVVFNAASRGKYALKYTRLED